MGVSPHTCNPFTTKRLWRFVTAALVVFGLSAPSRAAESGMLLNGGFETDLSGWTHFFLDGCSGSQVSQDGAARIAVAQASSTRWHQQFYQTSSIVTGTTYYYQFKARCESGSRNVDFVIERDGGDYFKFVDQQVALSSQWQTVAGSFIASATAQIKYAFYGAYSTIPFLIDDCYLGTQPPSGNIAPVAVAGDDQTITAGETVLLNGSGSYDPDNGPQSAQYYWTWVAGPASTTIQYASTKMAYTTATIPGEYFYCLSMSDGQDIGRDTVKVTVLPTQTFTLTTSVEGQGGISANPQGPSYSPGQVVTLTAVAASGYRFVEWSGDAWGSSAQFSLEMSRDKAVTARFEPISGEQLIAAINVGGPAFTTAAGIPFASDNSFTGGNVAVFNGRAIAGTDDDVLYQSERWGSCAYTIGVPENGAYKLVLHFAECYWSAANSRVFDVVAEGQTIVDNLDVFARVGRDAAHDVAVEVAVNDGVLNLNFTNPTVDQPKVCAIAVYRVNQTTVNDAEVTCIGRTPRYPRYDVAYQQYFLVTDDFTPYYTSWASGLNNGQTPQTKRWPESGENVTFTAHVLNRGNVNLTHFAYTWKIDGEVVSSSVWDGSVAPGEVAEVPLLWGWDTEQHTIGFEVALQGDPTPEDNRAEDYTNALALATFIEQSYAARWAENTANYPNCTTPVFTQWLRKHVVKLNQMLAEAGCVERVRYDRLEIVPDGTIPATVYDLSGYDGFWPNVAPWIFNPGRDDQRINGYYDRDEDIDYAMLHEIGHQCGIIDIYQLNVEPEQNKVNGQGYMAAQGLMNSVKHFINPHTAQALNNWRGKRRGYYGQYLYDVPARNYLRIVDGCGNPIADATIRVYQKVNSPNGIMIPNLAKFSGQTDGEGRYLLPNVAIDPSRYPAIETGNVLRANPFGYINCVGWNGTFLIEIVKDGETQYQWIDIMAFNLAYWQGNTETATYTITTDYAQAKSLVYSQELTEGNYCDWTVSAADFAPSSLSDDPARFREGVTSLKLQTGSGADVLMRYEASGSLSPADVLHVWFYAENESAYGFQNNSPRIVVGSAAGSYSYQASSVILNECRGAWKHYTIPLAGDGVWQRSQSGAPDLAATSFVEIHADTWDYGFTLWVDGLRFEQGQ